MKLYNPPEVAVRTENPVLGVLTVFMYVIIAIAFIAVASCYLGAAGLVLSLVGIGASRVLYAVFKGK